MRYRVQLWRTSTSRKPEFEHVARGLDVDDAIGSVMKTFEWGYANRAFAVPVDKNLEDASPGSWRRHIRCRISGEISFIRDDSWKDQPPTHQNSFADSLWRLL
jgi:hypothetical protein